MKRLTFLDGLRGFGAAFVVLYHVFCDGLPFDRTAGDHLKLLLPFNGPFAVLVFFVVSGFSLSVGYLAGGGRESLTKIAIGRYPRLAIPIFIACAIVYVAMVSGLQSPAPERIPPFDRLMDFQPTFHGLMVFSLSDVFFNYERSRTYIAPLWTMRFELAGSFLVLAMIFVARGLPGRLLIFGATGTIIVAVTQNTTWMMLALFPIGAILADCFNRGLFDRIPKFVGIALIACGAVAPFVLSLDFSAWHLISATAFVFGCLSVPQIKTWLSSGLAKRLGTLSFPLYLIHGPVLCIIGEPMMRHFGHSAMQRMMVDIVVLLLCFLAGVAFIPVNEFAIRISRSIGEMTVRRWLEVSSQS